MVSVMIALLFVRIWTYVILLLWNGQFGFLYDALFYHLCLSTTCASHEWRVSRCIKDKCLAFVPLVVRGFWLMHLSRSLGNLRDTCFESPLLFLAKHWLTDALLERPKNRFGGCCCDSIVCCSNLLGHHYILCSRCCIMGISIDSYFYGVAH